MKKVDNAPRTVKLILISVIAFMAHLSYVNDNPDRWDELDYEHFKTNRCNLDRQNYIYAKSTPDGYELI